MSDWTDLRALDCAGRAANRAAAVLHHELERGTASLKAIALIAPMLGTFVTTLGVIRAFAFYGMPTSNYGETSGNVGEVFFFIALSLPVAILAGGGFQYLDRQLAIFDFEMRATILNLLNDLARVRPSGN